MNAIRESTGRVVTLASAAWAVVVAVASIEGAFAQFDAQSIAAFAALVSAYAVTVFFVDAELRAHAARTAPAALRAIAAAALGLLCIALARHSAPLATFIAPIAALAITAAVRAPKRKTTTTSSAKSPGATRAAT